MLFVQRLVTCVDCEAAVRCGRYGEQQTLDALLHSGRTEACPVTALADQPAVIKNVGKAIHSFGLGLLSG